MNIINNCNANFSHDCGIYLIRCTSLNKEYIGSTRQNFRARYSNHIKFLKSNNLQNKNLQNDYNIYGQTNFEFEILEICDEKNIVEREQYYIDNIKPFYNIKKIAINHSNTNLGKKFTTEHVKKIRLKSKLFKHKNINKIIDQNKKGACKFKIINNLNNNIFYINSTKELKKLLNIVNVEKYYNRNYKQYTIIQLKSQKKSVKLFIDNNWKTFDSYEKCDKFLNKWRGFTSTKSFKNVKTLEEFPVQFINKDIV